MCLVLSAYVFALCSFAMGNQPSGEAEEGPSPDVVSGSLGSDDNKKLSKALLLVAMEEKRGDDSETEDSDEENGGVPTSVKASSKNGKKSLADLARMSGVKVTTSSQESRHPATSVIEDSGYWESNGSKPHTITLTWPKRITFDQVRLMREDRDSYTPERGGIIVDGARIKEADKWEWGNSTGEGSHASIFCFRCRNFIFSFLSLDAKNWTVFQLSKPMKAVSIVFEFIPSGCDTKVQHLKVAFHIIPFYTEF